MFFRRPPRREPAPEAPRDDPHSSTERITNPTQIARFLQLFKDGQCLLNVTIHGVAGSFNSAVLRVYPQRELLILDELNPRAGHEALLKAGRLNISCRLHGVEYRFATVLQRVDEQRGIAFYFVAMPQVLLHIQRRNHFRVPVDGSAGIELCLPILDEDAHPSQTTLLDLSASGLGMQLTSPTPPNRGEVLPGCALHLPGGAVIRSELEIRFVHARDRLSPVRLGGQFLKLDRQARDQLNALIRELERRHLRKQDR
jgi:c-di-GMP-binding flagellar brake protein YcgR